MEHDLFTHKRSVVVYPDSLQIHWHLLICCDTPWTDSKGLPVHRGANDTDELKHQLTMEGPHTNIVGHSRPMATFRPSTLIQTLGCLGLLCQGSQQGLVTRHELGGIGPGVVCPWVSQVVLKVLDGALASHNGLREQDDGRV